MISTPRSRRPRLVAMVAVIAGAAGLAAVAASPAGASSRSVASDPYAGAAPRPVASAPVANADWNKARVGWFYDQLFNRGNVAVVDRFVRPDYIQHNPQAPNGSAALKQLVSGLKAKYPTSSAKIYRILGEGDLVAVHSNVKLTPSERGTAVVDIFRLQDGLIVEHWDVIQQVPETTVSGNDMFSTLSAPRLPFPDRRSDPAQTRRIGLGLYTGLFVDRDASALTRLADPSYIQHNPQFPSGTAAVAQAFAGVLADPAFSVSRKRVIVDGDFVLVHSRYVFGANDPGTAAVDLWRVRDGKVVEHWDVLQPVPATSANTNTMF